VSLKNVAVFLCCFCGGDWGKEGGAKEVWRNDRVMAEDGGGGKWDGDSPIVAIEKIDPF